MLPTLLALDLGDNVTWHAIPLAALISLVYSASRYELPDRILHKALRTFVTIVVFLALVFGLLMVLSSGL